MKAVVSRVRTTSPSKTFRDPPGRGRSAHPHYRHDHLRHRRPYRPRRISGQARSDSGPRAGRRHQGARRRARGSLQRRRTRDRRGHHAVRTVLLLSERGVLAVRRRAGRLEVRQYHQRRLGGIPARAGCEGQPRAHSRGLADEDVLMCPDIFNRPVRRRTRQHQGGRQRRRVRARANRPVRNARREAQRRVAHHRGRTWRGSRCPAASAPTSR